MRRIYLFFKVFLFWTLAGTAGKVAFMLFHSPLFSGTSPSDWLSVVWHGLRLDLAIAGYATLLPAVLLVLSCWTWRRPLLWVWNAYGVVAAVAVSVATVVNIGLYGYWGFPLDATPLLYLRTSPSDALASLTLWQTAGWASAVVAACVVLSLLYIHATRRVASLSARPHRGIASRLTLSAAIILLSAALILPIRGGVSTGTNHTGSVYFSTNIRLNHAAVNPLFCFIESVTHQQDIASRYRFMPDGEASRLFTPLTFTQLRTDSAAVSVPEETNVVMVVLESFSKYIMTEGGHVSGIVPRLDRLAREGVYFTRFYANSFRTDRALVSILSGLPAQPTMSVMDLPKKSNALPSVARTLAHHGYDTSFYYGGDADYSNMRSYLMATGYRRIVSETDFRPSERTGKWGVADGPLLQRALADIRRLPSPFFVTVMTGSSHEPFDVPYKSHISSPELNAFHYADACLGAFIDSLRRTPQWEKTLVVILPDHLGCYPQHIDNYALWRYELPLLLTGGAAGNPRRIDTICSQTDLPATLLALLGYDHSDFLFSKDIFDTRAPHFAFFTLDDGMGMVTETTRIIHDNHSSRLVIGEGAEPDSTLRQAKAYLQKLYDYIANRVGGKH